MKFQKVNKPINEAKYLYFNNEVLIVKAITLDDIVCTPLLLSRYEGNGVVPQYTISKERAEGYIIEPIANRCIAFCILYSDATGIPHGLYPYSIRLVTFQDYLDKFSRLPRITDFTTGKKKPVQLVLSDLFLRQHPGTYRADRGYGLAALLKAQKMGLGVKLFTNTDHHGEWTEIYNVMNAFAGFPKIHDNFRPQSPNDWIKFIDSALIEYEFTLGVETYRVDGF
jgi:hypothetical protein